MNFFRHQENARKKTGLLICLLGAAVLCLIILTTVVVSGIMYYLSSNTTSMQAVAYHQLSFSQHLINTLNSEISAWIGFGVILVVAGGSIFKLIQLSHGGRTVAEALGGKLIHPDSRTFNERKVLNVVEEMAIASGNPVPPVYLLNEQGINAFAAGYSRRDAVIGVTQGCIDKLSRDELQGVIAHEFSHIHNGDMRLNMRLTAVLHGILLIGLIGYYVTHGSSSSYRSRNRGNQIALGMALVVIGYVGTFFGNIIKAAVSRQREYLADASAVQFTRNPAGISGALKKIGGYSQKSALQHSNAAQFSHMYFASGITTFFASLMATHPPLSNRIKRIEPRWDGTLPLTDNTNAPETHSEISQFSGTGNTENGTAAIHPDKLTEISDATAAHVNKADDILRSIPSEIHNACLAAFSARAVVYALLLDQDKTHRQNQLAELKQRSHPATFQELSKIGNGVLSLPREHALALLHLCMPALKTLSTPQYEVFKKNLIALIQADNKINFFEWCLYRITTKNIEQSVTREHYSLNSCKNEIAHLLEAIAIAGRNSDKLHALNMGLQALNFPLQTQLKIEVLQLQTLDKALSRLEKLKPLAKPQLLKAAAEVINADGLVSTEEKEFFRAIGDSLNCPIPPLS
ncbi:Protease HtpX [Thalassocella blandensis]|nr:Protease HtpX [Thalassocella blandensis]